MATATSKSEIWYPRTASQSKYAYLNKGIDRPGATTKMFREVYNKTWKGYIRDAASGNNVEFKNTMSDKDNRTKDMDKIWSKDDGNFCSVESYVKIDNWQPVHIGSINGIHSAADAKSAVHSPLFGYTGIRFEYRWPTRDPQHWKQVPVSIPYGMMHFLNVANGSYSSYEIICDQCSPSNRDFWVDRYATNDDRQNNNWKGAYYKLKQSSAVNQIRNNQLSLVGVSFQIKKHDKGGASHTSILDIQNLTPIYDDNPQSWRPMMMKPKSNPYNKTNNNAVPFEIYRKS